MKDRRSKRRVYARPVENVIPAKAGIQGGLITGQCIMFLDARLRGHDGSHLFNTT